jgi:hypothetical protein
VLISSAEQGVNLFTSKGKWSDDRTVVYKTVALHCTDLSNFIIGDKYIITAFLHDFSQQETIHSQNNSSDDQKLNCPLTHRLTATKTKTRFFLSLDHFSGSACWKRTAYGKMRPQWTVGPIICTTTNLTLSDDDVATSVKIASTQECNYGMRVSESVSCLTKFIVNNIHIYGFKSIYYKSTFCN